MKITKIFFALFLISSLIVIALSPAADAHRGSGRKDPNQEQTQAQSK